MDAGPPSFQPMNVNFGLFPPLARAPARDATGGRLRGASKIAAKKQTLCKRALHDLEGWLSGRLPLAAE
jgi:methylenetetrahydrofolate--tRNA-(uracil-5-)-methyltransferase